MATSRKLGIGNLQGPILTTDVLYLPVLKARIEAATAGPWVCDDDGSLKTVSGRLAVFGWKREFQTRHAIDERLGEIFGEVISGGATGRHEEGRANRAFIASARTDLPRCVKVIEALCDVLERRASDLDEFAKILRGVDRKGCAELAEISANMARIALAQVKRE